MLSKIGDKFDWLFTISKQRKIANDWRALYEITTLTDSDILELPDPINQKVIKEYKKQFKKEQKIKKYYENI